VNQKNANPLEMFVTIPVSSGTNMLMKSATPTIRWKTNRGHLLPNLPAAIHCNYPSRRRRCRKGEGLRNICPLPL